MIEKLTKKQEAIIHQTRDEWLDYFFSCKNELNKKEAEEGIHWLYELSGLENPKIVFLDGPLEFDLAAKHIGDQAIINDSVGDPVWDSIWDSIWASVRNPVRGSIRVSVSDSVWNPVRDSVWSPVSASVKFSVWNPVNTSVRGSGRVFHISSDCVGISDYSWVSLFDFFEKINGVKNNNFKKFKNLLRSGIYSLDCAKEICFVSGLPSKIIRNNRNNPNHLHCEDGPAIEFRDGYQLYFWKGIAVPKKLIETPKKITKKDLEANKNLEVRRAFIEKLGIEAYYDILSNGDGLDLIDEDIDNQGFPMKLFGFDFESERIQVLQVICPSTERKYNLYPLNQKCTNVWQAKASTFNLKAEEFSPIYES